MSRKRKRHENYKEQDSKNSNINDNKLTVVKGDLQSQNATLNGDVLFQETAKDPIDIDQTLTKIYAAFTEATLIQQPLLDGNCFYGNIFLPLAFKNLDHCADAIDWSIVSSQRDSAMSFISANPDFLSTAVNLWGVSWDV